MPRHDVFDARAVVAGQHNDYNGTAPAVVVEVRHMGDTTQAVYCEEVDHLLASRNYNMLPLAWWLCMMRSYNQVDVDPVVCDSVHSILVPDAVGLVLL